MVWFYSLLRLYNLTVSPRSDFHKSCAFPFHLHMCYTANIFTIHWIASFPNSIRILFRNILFAFIAVVTMRMEYLWKLCNAKINACVYYMQCMHHTYDTKSNFTIKHREEFFFFGKKGAFNTFHVHILSCTDTFPFLFTWFNFFSCSALKEF